MLHFRVFGFIAISLCFVACLCAHGIISKEEAKQKVKAVQAFTKSLLKKAQQKYKDAEYVKASVRFQREKAQKAATEAETAAKGNTKAEEIARKAKSALDDLLQIYSDANNKAEQALTPLTELKKKVIRLDDQAEVLNVPAASSAEEYLQLSESAENITNETKILQTEIDKKTRLLNSAESALHTLSGHAQKAQLAKYQVDANVAVSGIQTQLNEAQKDIDSAEKVKNETNEIVKELEELFKKTPPTLIQRINRMFGSAESQLDSISSKVNEMEDEQKTMTGMKTYADEVLLKVMELTDDGEAQKELRSVNYAAKQAEDSFKKIKEKLKSAGSNVLNAKYRKQDALRELSKISSEPTITKDTETNTPGQTLKEVTTSQTNKHSGSPSEKKSENSVRAADKNPVNNAKTPLSKTRTKYKTQDIVQTPSKRNTQPSGEDNEVTKEQKQTLYSATEASQNGLKVKPTLLNSEQKVIETSEDSMQQVSDKPTTEEEEGEQPKKKQSEILKEKLPKNSKNVKNIPLLGGAIPSFGTENDSSMTLYVPLLAALIASAVLH